MIVISTWGLLRDSLRLSLDGVPQGMDYKQIGRLIAATPGVKSLHHLHIWALSTTEIALTVHIVVEDMKEMEVLKCKLKNELREAGIVHATLEFETPGSECQSGCC